MDTKLQPRSVDAYIAAFPEHTRVLLEQVRATIQAAAPHAQEVISYQMPAYKQGTVLIYFAGNKQHIGLYPTSSGIAAFQAEFDRLGYKWSKGAVQFPLNQPLPVDLITRITQFRLQECLSKKKAT